MKKFLHILCLLSMSTSLTIEGAVEYAQLQTPDNKQLLLLGDMHDLLDSEMMQRFYLLINHLFRAPLKSSIPFIAELDKDRLINQTLVPPNLRQLLLFDDAQKENQFKPLDFIWISPRSPESADLANFINRLSKQVVELLPTATIAAHYKLPTKTTEPTDEHEALWPIEFGKFKEDAKLIPLTVKRYRDYLESNHTKLKALVEKHKANKQLVLTLLKAAVAYGNAKNKCFELLKAAQDTDSLPHVICSLFDRCATAEERMTLFDELEQILSYDTDFLFLELNFLDTVVEQMRSNNAVCILTNTRHSEKISSYLIEGLGCKKVRGENAVTRSFPLFSALNRTAARAMFLIPALNEFLEPITYQPNYCWNCNAYSRELKVCKRCYRAAYCNPTCQKTDWEKHKMTCGKELKKPLFLQLELVKLVDNPAMTSSSSELN